MDDGIKRPNCRADFFTLCEFFAYGLIPLTRQNIKKDYYWNNKHLKEACNTATRYRF